MTGFRGAEAARSLEETDLRLARRKPYIKRQKVECPAKQQNVNKKVEEPVCVLWVKRRGRVLRRKAAWVSGSTGGGCQAAPT